MPFLEQKPDVDAATIYRRLGIGRTKFWDIVYAHEIPYIRWSSKCIRFPAESVRRIEALYSARVIASGADLARQVDGRRKENKGLL